MLKLIINHEMKSISILSFNVWFGMVSIRNSEFKIRNFLSRLVLLENCGNSLRTFKII